MRYPGRRRQGGAVAVIVGLLSVLVLFGMMGIAVDLSYLYARKTELQNAADAAALSGAKELNQTAAGVTAAVAAAIATFGQNATGNLISGQSIDIARLRLGACANPSDRLPLRTPNCAFVDASSVGSDAAAAGLTFIEVDTGATSAKSAFFMPVIGGPGSASALGYAVAGHYFSQITPIGICAVTTTQIDHYVTTNELLEYGFRRGVGYDLLQMGPLGASSLPYLVNPVDTDPATCDPSHSSTTFTIPFVCTGNSAVGQGPVGSNFAIGNTGLSAVVISALNSRFGLYGGAGWGTNQCDPASAPPDKNIKQYCYRPQGSRCFGQPGGGWVPSAVDAHSAYNLDSGNTAIWNSSTLSYQTVQLDVTTKKPCYNAAPAGAATPGWNFAATAACGGNTGGPNYGVLWSYGPAYRYSAGAPGSVGAPFTAAEANLQSRMYNNSATTMTYFGTNPLSPTYPATHPYAQTSGSMFASGGASGVANRRVINLLLIDCNNVTGAGACGEKLPVLGIGKFFMPVLADPTGGKKIEVEFAGLVSPVDMAEIKLYR